MGIRVHVSVLDILLIGYVKILATPVKSLKGITSFYVFVWVYVSVNIKAN